MRTLAKNPVSLSSSVGRLSRPIDRFSEVLAAVFGSSEDALETAGEFAVYSLPNASAEGRTLTRNRRASRVSLR